MKNKCFSGGLEKSCPQALRKVAKLAENVHGAKKIGQRPTQRSPGGPFSFQAKLSKNVPTGTTRLHTRLQCGPGGTQCYHRIGTVSSWMYGCLRLVEESSLRLEKESNLRSEKASSLRSEKENSF